MIARPRPGGAVLAAAAAGLLWTVLAPAVLAAPADFPAKDSRYHNYPEMIDDVQAVAAAHPELVEVASIGSTPGGRKIWLAKVSDNVATDENEPEVLVIGGHHGDEHLSVEQALYLFHALVDDYGTDAEIKGLVDSREIWIVFMLNPDGAQYDLTGDPYTNWRKNRQPNPGSTYVGTDLNRNYAYKWGCCGGSSGNPSGQTYRGSAPFSAPETKALADFVLARVIDGRQQIRTAISLHASGELMLFPYAHTTVNVPPDMTSIDRTTFVDMATNMAATNGYTVRQSGDWYISDGDAEDWLYATQRIFAFTLELYPPEGSTGLGGHHPPDEVIAAETARNRDALLYLIEVANCPYRASGTQVANCGPLYDDLELARGWTVNPFGQDTATTAASGAFARGDPAATSFNGPKQLGTAASGSKAFVTGLPAGATDTAYDLDGKTSVASRELTLPEDPAAFGNLTFRWYLSHTSNSTSADFLKAWVVDTETNAKTKVFERLGRAVDIDAAWQSASVSLSAFAGRTIRLLFVAADGSNQNLVEAGFDDVRIQRPG